MIPWIFFLVNLLTRGIDSFVKLFLDRTQSIFSFFLKSLKKKIDNDFFHKLIFIY